MKQYIEAKEQHPDAVLLLRVDNFYETFSDDAVAAGEIPGSGDRQCDGQRPRRSAHSDLDGPFPCNDDVESRSKVVGLGLYAAKSVDARSIGRHYPISGGKYRGSVDIALNSLYRCLADAECGRHQLSLPASGGVDRRKAQVIPSIAARGALFVKTCTVEPAISWHQAYLIVDRCIQLDKIIAATWRYLDLKFLKL